MNTLLKKAIKDLLIHPGRTIMVIFALVIGLWGVGSILVSYTILRSDLNENFRKTIPFHVAFVSEDFGKLDLKALRKEKEIQSAEFRDMAIERIEVSADNWLPLYVYGVEDFQNFQLAKIYYQEGQKIPDAGTILVERDIKNVRVSKLDVGSLARIRVGDKNKTVRISGMNFDPAQAPATQDAFVYSYTDRKTFRDITGKEINQRLILRFNNVQTKAEVKKQAEKLQREFNKQGITIQKIDIPKFNEHPHQFQLNTLLMTNGIIGFLAFLMGAVLVSQLMKAILSRQVRQIGILKAIGATRIQILFIYLLMVFSLGIISSIIAVPLAIVTGYGYAGFVAKIINFEILTRQLPHGVYAGLTWSGLLLPVLFSLSAIVKAMRLTVSDALADYGINSQSSSGFISTRGLITRLSGFLPDTIKLGIRNSLRRKSRLLVTVVTMALGVAIFDTGFNVRQSLADFLANNQKSMKYDVQVVLNKEIPVKEALAPFHSLNKKVQVETWNGGKGKLQSDIVSTMDHVGIVALPFDTSLMTFEVIKGRWIKPSEKTTEVVMNQGALESFGYNHETMESLLNKTLILKIRSKKVEVKLAGVVREFDKAKIYMDKTRFDELVNPEHLVNSLMFVLPRKEKNKSYQEVIELKREIEHAISDSNLSVLYVMSQAERSKIIYDHLNIILFVLTFLAFLVLIVGALGMASATGINIMERTREIGVLRAIGAAPRSIYQIFVSEGIIVSIVSIIAGLGLGWPLSRLAARYFGSLILGANMPLEPSFSHSGFIITLAITLAFGWLASRLPARGAIKVSTREALVYE